MTVRQMEPIRGRSRAVPWYRVPNITGVVQYADEPDAEGNPVVLETAFQLVHRDDLFIGDREVEALAQMAMHSARTVTVEWLQMDLIGKHGAEVPKQHKESGLAVAYVDREVGAFYVLSAKRSSVFAIALDCITDMSVDDAEACPDCQHLGGTEHFTFCRAHQVKR